MEISPGASPARDSLAAIVVAAGSSTRMDGIDKIWATLADQPVLAHSLLTMQESATELIVVVKQPDEVRVVQMLERLHIRIPWRITRGGSRRQDSVRCGLRAIRTGSYVAVHDAARPLATSELLMRTLKAAKETGAAIPAIRMSDTIKRGAYGYVVETVERTNLWAIQTPQVFRMDTLMSAYRVLEGRDDDVTDDAMLIERTGGKVSLVEGEQWNFKVTTSSDLKLAEAVVRVRHEGSIS